VLALLDREGKRHGRLFTLANPRIRVAQQEQQHAARPRSGRAR